MKKLLAGSLCVLIGTAAHAAPKKKTAKTKGPIAKVAKTQLPIVAAQAARSGLPLRDVVLFSSGVGYFGRSGVVSGGPQNALQLSFRTEQINDILKSLVVMDAQGQVLPVTYTTKDALGRRLRGVGQNLGSNLSLGALLRNFQGARVRATTRTGAVEGRIISVSEKEVPAPKEGTVTREFLNLMTAKGLATLSFGDITGLQLLDARLDSELRGSLELLAGGLDDERQNVQINLGAGAPRPVRVGYLQETPVWKTSYRLVLDAAGDPLLQGWGIVENTSDEDWKDVRLSLVSGRPISFIQDLYQPLYVPRPVVASQVAGSPLPQTYGETLGKQAEMEEKRVAALEDRKAAAKPMAPPAPMASSHRFSLPVGRDGIAAVDAQNGLMLGGTVRESIAADALARGTALAQGEARGELFEYAIAQPVTLPRQQAAMVPIINQRIQGQRVSIYDPNTGERALLGVRLKNNTALHLSGGPVTVFRDGIYAGDAQFTNVQPNEERLISYAVDLDLVPAPKQPSFRRETVSFSARSGVLVISHRDYRDITYTLRNKSREEKTVLVQQPIEYDYTLIEPKEADEKTAQHLRFKVTVPAEKTVEFTVKMQRPLSETLALFDMNIDALIAYSRNAQMSPKLRAALEDLAARRRAIADNQAQLARVQREIADIDQEQNRIRQNMERLDRQSELYKQYVAKLTEQETRVNTLAEQRAKLRDAEAELQKQLRAFVDNLTVE